MQNFQIYDIFYTPGLLPDIPQLHNYIYHTSHIYSYSMRTNCGGLIGHKFNEEQAVTSFLALSMDLTNFASFLLQIVHSEPLVIKQSQIY